MAKLKQSRDKLLEEIDSQWEEMDRMAAEGRATVEELGEQRRLAAAWEFQAQVRISSGEGIIPWIFVCAHLGSVCTLCMCKPGCKVPLPVHVNALPSP